MYLVWNKDWEFTIHGRLQPLFFVTHASAANRAESEMRSCCMCEVPSVLPRLQNTGRWTPIVRYESISCYIYKSLGPTATVIVYLAHEVY